MWKNALLTFFCLFSTFSFACTCIGKSKIKHAIKASDAVFVGNVLSAEKAKIKLDSSSTVEMMEYKILVTERIKGKAITDTMKIYTGFGNGDCGFNFKIGEKYIIYSIYTEYTLWGKVDFLSTDICTRTNFYSEEELRKIKRLVNRKNYR